MQFISATTTETEVDLAVPVLVSEIHARLEAGPVDLVVVFLSAHFTHRARQLTEAVRRALQPRVLLGCTAEGVIDQEAEIEEGPAITLLAAQLPGVELTPILLQPTGDDWHTLLLDEDEFRRRVEVPSDTQLFLLLGDPFSTPMDDILVAFENSFAGVPVVGGMASGALRPYGNALLLDDRVVHEGAVGVAFYGDLEIDIIVSQGCRPIWRPFRVQEAHSNEILNLDGRAPLAWLQDLIPELSEEDRALLQNGLFVGRAVVEREVLGRGDFLIRGVIGIDPERGSIAIGDSVMDGQTIQFHLRDAITAREDLEMMLIPQTFRPPPSGALLFTCNGRGTRLYDYPNGDISVIQHNLAFPPVAGFFCAGEIGPLGASNFLHGHTASLLLFRPREAS